VAAPELLRDVLPGVSRSFALSLRVLPDPLRRPFGVTYLVARAADTIADTRALPPAARLTALRALRDALADGAASPPALDGSAPSGHTAAERTLLNLVQRMSGIATLTAKFVDAVKGTKAKILDTRKTTPGWRRLEKYAVRAGGGVNHRLDLARAVLIKDNHLKAVDGDVGVAVKRVRELAPPGAKVEVECDSLDQVRAAIEAGADEVLVDNMPLDQICEAVALAKGRAAVEASGGVTIDTVRRIAETGVDYISVGAASLNTRRPKHA